MKKNDEMNDHPHISKFLSYILRHHPESIGITLDSDGWVEIDLLLAQVQQHGRSISRQELQETVDNNSKKRFTVSEDGRRIRAAQGHSTGQVRMRLAPQMPPDVLYHGTATRFLDSIMRQGLQAGERHHVHLSADRETAVKVGQRHGKPVVLRIDAAAMHQAGRAFYLSDNQVWLTEAVPPQYLAVAE